MRKILLQILLLVSLSVMFAVSIVLICHKVNTNYDAKYKYIEPTISFETDSIKKSNIVVYNTYNGKIKRVDNEIKEILLEKSKDLSCTVGSVINSFTDISLDNDSNNYVSGRVIAIEETLDYYVISIDSIDNYKAYISIPDNYYYILNIIDTTKYNLYTSFGYADVLGYDVTYDKDSQCFTLIFDFDKFDESIYASMDIKFKIHVKDYFKVYYVEEKVIKDITEDYYVILDKVIDKENNVIEEVRYKIIDYVNKKLVIDFTGKIDEEYVVYNKSEVGKYARE